MSISVGWESVFSDPAETKTEFSPSIGEHVLNQNYPRKISFRKELLLYMVYA